MCQSSAFKMRKLQAGLSSFEMMEVVTNRDLDNLYLDDGKKGRRILNLGTYLGT